MLKRCKKCGEFHGEECLARAFTVWQDDSYFFATIGGVVVVKHEHDAEEKFFVEGEVVPRYYANKLRGRR